MEKKIALTSLDLKRVVAFLEFELNMVVAFLG